MESLKELFKKETVFCISFILALISALVVKPDGAYLAYPDYRTISLLFCLMIIVAGFQSLGVFMLLGQFLLRRAGSLRNLPIIMVLLCFFCSMIITNDVTLITFVPFTMLVYRMIGKESQVLKTVVLETIAANLGSMATPIGNPQNLYLYSAYGIGLGQFAWAVLPYAALSLALLLGAMAFGKNEPLSGEILQEQQGPKGEELLRALLPFLLLLALCLLVVFRVLPYQPVLTAVAAVIFLVNRKLFREVDYFLLLTFLFFFIFIGNMKRIPEVSCLLTSLVVGRQLLLGILASQVISNVPAAILLSGFTGNYPLLLTAVNLGGLGTLIASLASLISFKFFAREYPEQKGRFLKVFTIWNGGFLLILTAAAVLLNR